MKRRWKIALLLTGLLALVALFLFRGAGSAERAAKELRLKLSHQGFKVDLEEFDFSATEDETKRAAALLAADLQRQASKDGSYHYLQILNESPAPFHVVGSNTAIVVWEEETLDSDAIADAWPVLREVFSKDRTELDNALEAALSGPIVFDLNAMDGMHMLLPHVSSLKHVCRTFSTRALLEMRDGNRDAAWTNLLAATRIATAYDVEMAEVSHLVRFVYAAMAYETAWQLLQAHGWTDEQLTALQQEWEKVEFFNELPDTLAFTRASIVNELHQERLQPPDDLGTFRELINYPQIIPNVLKRWWGSIKFRRFGTYEVEQSILQYYVERENHWRKALQGSTWERMRQLPGVANSEPFVSPKKYYSSAISRMNTRQTAMGFARGKNGIMARAARAEARRRLAVTAIALERFRARNGSYPDILASLVPAFLAHLPNDFMDGKPLRYVRAGNGFSLYSVDLDCIDHGGTMPESHAWGGLVDAYDQEPKSPADLVWPIAASKAEASQHRRTHWNVQRQRGDERDSTQADWRWERTARRQARIDEILAREQKGPTKEPTVDGRPISEVLRNASYLGTTNLSISDLLTLRQVITGEEPEGITFELPIHYPT